MFARPRPQFAPAALFCASLFASTASAQTGRTLSLSNPPVLGSTMTIDLNYPPAALGNIHFVVWGLVPSTNSSPLVVPGVPVQGLWMLDPTNWIAWNMGELFDASGRTSYGIPIRNEPALVGVEWEMQSIDTDGATLFLSDNDLSLRVEELPAGLVSIPAGTFQRGSTAGNANEQPVHATTITQPFWMSKYEVTQAAYQAVMGSNPSFFQGANYADAPDRPVEFVSWNDAVAYCAALTAQEAAAGRLPTGYRYRLPTEAEWEYGCRAGSLTEFHVGASLGCADANHRGTANYCVPNPVTGAGQTTVVGSYPANAFGLHDMHGNVAEWCLDSWNGSANYPSGSVSNPYVQVGSQRILRGGSWADTASLNRAAVRRGAFASLTNFDRGFRVVLAREFAPRSADLVWIAPSAFNRGSTSGNANEQPVHPVTITQPFWVSRYEVTQAEYTAVMGNNPSFFQGANYADAAERPVGSVSWNDAVAYCAALTAQGASLGQLPAGYEYRLPTEAEWELCCRAGTTTEFHVGATMSCANSNHRDGSGAHCVPDPLTGTGQTVVVGSYAPNALGLHDMHGNVGEWCLDAWDGSNNYPTSPVSDPLVRTGRSRVIRGGHWNEGEFRCRSAFRNRSDPPTSANVIGFRVVLGPVLR